MQPATSSAYGDGLARHFRADATTHLTTGGTGSAKLAVTRVRRDTPGHGLTSPLPTPILEWVPSALLSTVPEPLSAPTFWLWPFKSSVLVLT